MIPEGYCGYHCSKYIDFNEDHVYIQINGTKQMVPVYEEMQKWMGENGYVPAGPVYEHYYNGPEFPENELVMKIVMPVEATCRL